MLYAPFPPTFSRAPRSRTVFRAPIRALLVLALLAGWSCTPGPEEGSGPAPRELSIPGEADREWPRLARDGDRITLSWLETETDGRTALRFAPVGPDGVGEPRTVVRSESFFRNWADFPSVVPVADSLLLAHWLVRGPAGGYDYGIRVAGSRDGGRTWSEPRVPHGDDTPTEHGFVTIFPLKAGGRGMVWLDGRDFARVDDPEEARMSLRFREVGADGFPGPEVALDMSTCDCCQTDAALTDRGPVVVYRDREPGEVRDISILRRVDGVWSEPAPVHRDGWVMPACPVNGPGVAARGSLVAVAWFTAAGDRPEVKVAFSRDGGASFGGPVRVDEGDPVGRVDVRLLDSGDAVVSWLERTGEAAEIRIRRVHPGGATAPSRTVASSSGARASGFPRTALTPWGELLLTWTEPSGPRIRLVALDPATLGTPGPPGVAAR